MRTYYTAMSCIGLAGLGWAVFWRKQSMAKALVLSIPPTLLFLESGLTTGNVPLAVLALMFGACHITVIVQNA